jgi:hypothetical protein
MQPYDKDLKGKNAIFQEGEAEVWAIDRYCALKELNKHGYRVLQFLIAPDSLSCGEWVLVEEIE